LQVLWAYPLLFSLLGAAACIAFENVKQDNARVMGFYFPVANSGPLKKSLRIFPKLIPAFPEFSELKALGAGQQKNASKFS
jgi:hypothetical protein